MTNIPNYYSKQNPIGTLNDEKVAEDVLLYVFNSAFPAQFSLFLVSKVTLKMLTTKAEVTQNIKDRRRQRLLARQNSQNHNKMLDNP